MHIELDDSSQNDNLDKPTEIPALVFGVGVTALAAVRALGKRGIRTYLVTGDGGEIRLSRWSQKVPASIGLCREPAELRHYLSRLPFSEAVLIACSDAWTRAVAALDGSLSERFTASVPEIETIDSLIDKGRLANLLDACSVPHPQTHKLNSVELLRNLPESCFDRAFLKPRDSERFLSHYGVKAFRTSSRIEAILTASGIFQDGHEILLQEYIPGPATAHYFVDGFVDREGEVRALFVRRRLRMFPADFGNSTYMVSIPPEEAAGAVQSIRRLLAHVRYRGIFSAEFKLDPRDGEFKLLEVNARPWWYLGFATRCGVDVAWMAYRDALGLPVESVVDYQIGAHCVYPYFDFQAFKALHRRGELGFWTWLASVLFSQKPIFWWRDPLPGLANYFGMLGRRARRPLHRTEPTVSNPLQNPQDNSAASQSSLTHSPKTHGLGEPVAGAHSKR